jgi:hypothetical protein
MENKLLETSKRPANRIFRLGVCILLVTLIGGCMAKYGRYNRDDQVFEAFNNEQVPLDYRYYYYHSGSQPIAVIGVEKKYDAGSTMWREVEPNTEKFKNMIIWIWEDFGYTRFAARILDPSGVPVGIMFTSIREVAIKFTDDNRIIVMPHTPFLWGPTGAHELDKDYYGSTDSDSPSSIPRRASLP